MVTSRRKPSQIQSAGWAGRTRAERAAFALPREGPNWGPLGTNLASNTVAGLIDNFGTAPVCGITLGAAVWQPKWQPVAAAGSAAAVGDRTLSVAATASV